MIRDTGAQTQYRGPVFRQSPPRYAEATERTLAGSARAGGRFNPQGKFGALYVSLDPETPFREMHRQNVREQRSVVEVLPRVLFALDVALHRVLDLTDEAVREAWNVPEVALTSNDWSTCQRVGREARDQGYEAIRFPSASGAGENLAIFLDQLGPGSYVYILNEDELRPGLA